MKTKHLLLTLLTSSIASYVAAKPIQYDIESTHSFVEYTINHLGYSNQTGKWYVESGSVIYDNDKISNSRVNAIFTINNIVTGLPALDEHLKGADFFNTESYPTAQFVSTKVVKVNKNKAKVYGNLTLKGITKPVVLNMTINQVAAHPMMKDTDVAGFSADTSIKRSDYNMGAYAPALGDKVNLHIEVEAVQSAK